MRASVAVLAVASSTGAARVATALSAAGPTAPRRAAAPAGADVTTGAPAAGYSFERTNRDGTPARWNPCRPVHYVVNAAAGPPDAASLVRSALDQVSAATGLRFVYDGPTGQTTSATRPLVVGGAWNPVLVSWEAPGDSTFFPVQGEDGEGGFTAVRNGQGRWVVVSGQVALDRSAASLPNFQAEGGWAHLLLHEWGHVVGLDHVTNRADVMNPVSWPGASVTYGPGDRAGLALLGSGGCLAEPSVAGLS